MCARIWRPRKRRKRDPHHRNADRFVRISVHRRVHLPGTDIMFVLREHNSVIERDLTLKRKIIEDQVGVLVRGSSLFRGSQPSDSFQKDVLDQLQRERRLGSRNQGRCGDALHISVVYCLRHRVAIGLYALLVLASVILL
jgi:hypothetical protein